ncbi:helix-hairpin-helix domain-containing protein family protein [Aphelenchoides avenae]|nr:helix-hairpin-helix domain-containing protein family protein [Aphelenchus avenae]
MCFWMLASVSKTSRFLPCTSQELNLDVVLLNGQSFRWTKLTPTIDGQTPTSTAPALVGVARNRVWKLMREDAGRVSYEVLARFATEGHSEDEAGSIGAGDSESDDVVFRDYFQLDVDLPKLYAQWTDGDKPFARAVAANGPLLEGIRILKQDPLETLLAFICSSNNNIKRISKMVERLCELYGTRVDVNLDASSEPIAFYDFPTLPQLQAGLADMQQKLRDSGFGYRAAYVAGTVAKLEEFGGIEWLHGLKALSYAEAKEQLMRLPGVGPKVADCICLMALGKNEVVPVDTHVFQITAAVYLPALKAKKTVSKQMMQEIGAFYAERFGPYAGWAHSVLFSAQLKHFDVVEKVTSGKVASAKKTLKRLS